VHATRSSKFADEEREELYLLREDGILYGVTAEQRFNGASGVSGFRLVAKFNCNGSGAMASLLLTQSLKDPDTLVVWGDMSDGEMVSVCLQPHNAVLYLLTKFEIGYSRNFPKVQFEVQMSDQNADCA
jgi:hypothetical protein